MTEFDLIEQIFNQKQGLPNQSDIQKGIGDDAAVTSLPIGARLVSCIDTLVQGRHFSGDWNDIERLAFAIGYKSVAVNVSDIAAMGAAPHSLLLALALPERLAKKSWLSEFAQGIFHACNAFDIALIGGDTTRSEQLVISVSAQGILTKDATPIYRSGAKVGDKVYVSGTLGDASFALKNPDSEIGKSLRHRLDMPTPRAALGQSLGKMATGAMIDISDGLYQDLSHICQQSGVDMVINLEKLPTSSELAKAELTERLRCQLTGGDDYELAFTLPANIAPPDGNTKVTCIGEVIAKQDDTTANLNAPSQPQLFYKGLRLSDLNPAPFDKLPPLSGYQHFNS